jgi:Transposase DDE domain
MQTHSQSRAQASAAGGYLSRWDALVGPEGVPSIPPRAGRPPRVSLRDLLAALTFHVMNGPGTLSDHFFQVFGTPLADSSWADRRARVPWEIFADLLRRALRPRATPGRHPDAFWRSWRLVAMDGTQFSLTNTPQVRAALPKAKTRRGRAAFAKITTAVLLELGLHNPLATAIGAEGESEWALALGLLAQLPPRSLLLGDRLYGVAAFAVHARTACAAVHSHFLLRARSSVKPQVIKRLRDGSRLVRVPVREKGRPRHILEWLEVREIRVSVGRAGHRSQALRLWTSLRDPRTAPGLELAQLYARRWEHELYYRELKRQIRTTDLLQSHTVDTGAQEIAALILASALLATERAHAAAGTRPVLRIRLGQVLHETRALWRIFAEFDDILTERQKTQIVQRACRRLRRCVTRPRRSRSCPRAMRQPMTAWPRLRRNRSVEGPLQFALR